MEGKKKKKRKKINESGRNLINKTKNTLIKYLEWTKIDYFK